MPPCTKLLPSRIKACQQVNYSNAVKKIAHSETIQKANKKGSYMFMTEFYPQSILNSSGSFVENINLLKIYVSEGTQQQMLH